MIFTTDGHLNLYCFSSSLRQKTNDLQAIVVTAQKTKSSTIESTHILITLNNIPQSLTRQLFQRHGITATELEEGLIACIPPGNQTTVPHVLEQSLFDTTLNRLFNKLDTALEAGEIEQIDEGVLLHATLEHLTTAVLDNLSFIQLSSQSLIKDLASLQDKGDCQQPTPFADSKLVMSAFSPAGQQVLRLMKAEAEALGYSQMDPRHLLLALLEVEGGVTQEVLYQQDLLPKKVQESLMRNLRARANNKRSQLAFDETCLDTVVNRIINQASAETVPDGCHPIAEVHLLRAFLQVETFALRQLVDAGLNLLVAKDAAHQASPEDEASPTGHDELRPWADIQKDLAQTLVGQEEALALCLPFIRRMRFDFHRPGKPAGVFLFCGPSGVGKTELAKGIARAVFGSEDNLIILEMGQFQTRESMNIFVGAPPGYIGYGEGKLTNGLRDKPRAVVLFDEVEKAHPLVFDALLRFLDEGQIDDPAGPIRDGSNCIIIMTSNVSTKGLEEYAANNSQGQNKWKIRRELKKALQNLPEETMTTSSREREFRFRPEFLNRIDEIVLFRHLDQADLTKIAQRYLTEYLRRLREEKQITLSFGMPNDPLTQSLQEDAAALIGHFCATVDEGARVALRVTQTAVLDPVIDFIYEHNCPPPVSLRIKLTPDPVTQEPRGIISFPEI